MFRFREATDRRDKIYALLGMGTLSQHCEPIFPDHQRDWKSLFAHLIRVIVSEDVIASTVVYNGRECGLLTGLSAVLGYVSQALSGEGGLQNVSIKSIHLVQGGSKAKQKQHLTDWQIHPCADPIREGDVLFLFEGATKPTLARLCDDHFLIIATAVKVPVHVKVTRFVHTNSLSASYSQIQLVPLSWTDFLRKGIRFTRRIQGLLFIDTDSLRPISSHDSSETNNGETLPPLWDDGKTRLKAVVITCRIVDDLLLQEELVQRTGVLTNEREALSPINRNHLRYLEATGNFPSGYQLLKLAVMIAIPDIFPSEVLESSDTSVHGLPLSIMPDLVEIRKVLERAPNLAARILQIIGRETQLYYRPDMEKIFHAIGEAVALLLELWGNYVSPPEIMNVRSIDAIHYEHEFQLRNSLRPLGLNARETASSNVLNSIIVTAARHSDWGPGVFHKLCEHLRHYNDWFYRMLMGAIIETDGVAAWSSSVAEHALAGDPRASCQTIYRLELPPLGESCAPLMKLLLRSFGLRIDGWLALHAKYEKDKTNRKAQSQDEEMLLVACKNGDAALAWELLRNREVPWDVAHTGGNWARNGFRMHFATDTTAAVRFY